MDAETVRAAVAALDRDWAVSYLSKLNAKSPLRPLSPASKGGAHGFSLVTRSNTHMTYKKLCLLLTLSLGIGVRNLAARPKIHVVDGPGSLTTITNLIKTSAPGDVHRVQFKTYSDVGAFSVNSLNVDSLIFERAEESADVLEFTGTLFQLKGVTGPVVFKNLAFKSNSGSAIFLDGISATPNSNLQIDSCQVFGDNLNSTFLSWTGSSSAVIEVKRSIVTGKNGSEGKIDLTGGVLKTSNNYFNYSGLFVGNTETSLEFSNNTSNRTQFRFNGQGTGTYSFRNNIFAHPSAQNKLPRSPQKYSLIILGFAGNSTAIGNARFSTWSGFDYATTSAFAEPANSVLTPFGDTNSIWDFRQLNDLQRGYQNPSEAKYPTYNIYPTDSIFSIGLSARDSVVLNMITAQIPRVVSASYGTILYPSTVDSTRTYWLQDTILKVAGPASVRTLVLPRAKVQGPPILFAESGGSYLAGVVGLEGSLIFANATPSAKLFIPAFAEQNTSKGSQVLVRGISTDTSMRFSNITRAGRTQLQSVVPGSGQKRWRVLEKDGRPFGYRDTTNAEGFGSLRFGLVKVGAEAPFKADSLSWILPDGALKPVTDSAGKYWGEVPFAPFSQAILVERLGVGAGRDTLLIPQGRLLSNSLKGHQVQFDSTFQPTAGLYPDMGIFTKGLSISWPGRGAGDTLFLEWRRSSAFQKAFFKEGSKATPFPPYREDSTSLTLALGIGDTGKTIFLARKYGILAGVKTTLVLGKDTVKDILSSKSGDIFLDSSFTLTGLDLDSLRILAKRQITLDNLEVSSGYQLLIHGLLPNREANLKGFVKRGGRWDTVTMAHSQGDYLFNVLPGDNAVLAAEILRPTDTLPIVPVAGPSVQVVNERVLLKPVLTVEEETRLKVYYVEIVSVDLNGKKTLETSKGLPGDSTFSQALDGSKLYSLRIGYESFSGRITWLDVPTIPQDPLLFLNAAVAAARPFRAAVWELVGFPWSGSVRQDIHAHVPANEGKKISIQEWKGKWIDVPANASLTKGKGYLGGFPKEFKPSPPPTFAWTWAPETLSLDTGWHLVSNPLPFQVADKSIGLEAASVSYFYQLDWEGSGPNAKPIWTVVDNLKPCRGYAVHVLKPTRMTFIPRPTGAAKSGLAKGDVLNSRMEFQFLQESGKVQSQLFLQPSEAPRPTPAAPFFKEGVSAHWGTKDGPVSKVRIGVDGVDEVFILSAPYEINLRVSILAGTGQVHPFRGARVLALWNPQKQVLTTLTSNPSLGLRAGENWFRLIEVEPQRLAELEFELKQASSHSFDLLQNYPNPFGSRTTLVYTVPFYADPQTRVSIEILSLDGTTVFRKEVSGVFPGRHTLPLEGIAWPSGQYVVRAQFKGAGASKVFQKKILHLEVNQ